MSSWQPLIDNKKGIIYFHNKLNNKIQFDYPKKYNYNTNNYEDIFFENWKKTIIINEDSNDFEYNWINIKNGFTQKVNPNSTTSILESALNNNLAFFELFIEYGGNINYIDNLKRNCLHYIAINDNYFLAKLLIKLGCNINKRDIFGISPFLYCIKYLSLKTMKLLVKNKCNINIRDNNGNTALHYAVMNKNTKLILYLLKNGAKLEIKNNKGEYPIDIAKNNLKIQRILIKYSCLIDDENYYKLKEMVNSEKYEELLIKKYKLLEDEKYNKNNNKIIKDNIKINSENKENFIIKNKSTLFPFISFKRKNKSLKNDNTLIKINNDSNLFILPKNKILLRNKNDKKRENTINNYYIRNNENEDKYKKRIKIKNKIQDLPNNHRKYCLLSNCIKKLLYLLYIFFINIIFYYIKVGCLNLYNFSKKIITKKIKNNNNTPKIEKNIEYINYSNLSSSNKISNPSYESK